MYSCHQFYSRFSKLSLADCLWPFLFHFHIAGFLWSYSNFNLPSPPYLLMLAMVPYERESKLVSSPSPQPSPFWEVESTEERPRKKKKPTKQRQRSPRHSSQGTAADQSNTICRGSWEKHLKRPKYVSVREGKHKQRKGENTVLSNQSQAGRCGAQLQKGGCWPGEAEVGIADPWCSAQRMNVACWSSSALPPYSQLIVLVRIDREFRMLWLFSPAMVERMVYHPWCLSRGVCWLSLLLLFAWQHARIEQKTLSFSSQELEAILISQPEATHVAPREQLCLVYLGEKIDDGEAVWETFESRNQRMSKIRSDLKVHLVPTPFHGQRHLLLDQASESPNQPSPEHFQGRGIHSFYGQPIPDPASLVWFKGGSLLPLLVTGITLLTYNSASTWPDMFSAQWLTVLDRNAYAV